MNLMISMNLMCLLSKKYKFSLQGVATGKLHGAILTNTEEWETKALEAGRRSGDLLAPIIYLPELHFSEFASAIADMKNSVSVSKRKHCIYCRLIKATQKSERVFICTCMCIQGGADGDILLRIQKNFYDEKVLPRFSSPCRPLLALSHYSYIFIIRIALVVCTIFILRV